MKLFLSLIISLFATSAFAQAVDGIYGNWESENPMYGQGVQFNASFNFTETEVSLTVQCLFNDGVSLSASASSLATYDGNNIRIHEPRQAVIQDGYRFCRATLDRAIWTAYFDGTGKMVLFVPGPYQTNRFVLVKFED